MNDKRKRPEFAIYETTLLRSLMAHMQSVVRGMAASYFELVHHPNVTADQMISVMNKARASDLRRTYTEMVEDLITLFPGEVRPVSFGELPRSGSFDKTPLGGRDPYRISLKALQKLADKRRSRGHPEFKLLKGVVLKKRLREDQ